jgi:hypothetical protein
MSQYRVYPLDAAGRLMPATVIESPNDAAALAAGAACTTGRPAEIWERSRFVGRISGLPPQGFLKAARWGQASAARAGR